MVMSGLEGNAATASFAIPGAPRDQVFNGLNAIGMLLFLYGVTVLPEIQDVLRPAAKTGNTSRSMIQAATVAHFMFVPLYLLVGIIGAWGGRQGAECWAGASSAFALVGWEAQRAPSAQGLAHLDIFNG
jgi:hypothetical protein